ncbi:hypothetical protein L7F22_046764 [Adiantum nelumboides]|nr:hypothetical protein [Adiantum nelumboides]
MAGIWWPTLLADAKEFVRRCDACQRAKMLTRVNSMPLRPMMDARAFAKWGIDFVGPIQPPTYKTQAQYIIVATDYLTKWAEAKATRKNDARTTTAFLYENVFTRYGLPIEIISDKGTHFLNEVSEYLLSEFMVIHNKSAPYHWQANGQAEHTNKILNSVLTKVVNTGRTDWEMNLHAALWTYRVSFKTALNATPFNLVYGLDAILPIEFLLPTLRVAMDLEWTGHELSERLVEDLEKLDEQRLMAIAHIYAQKRKQKQFFDAHLLTKIFKKRDLLKVPSTDAVSTDDEWQDGMDLRITVKLKDHNINALVDTGARMNAFSYSTYRKATDQPLQPGVIAIKGCNMEMTPALGLINLNVLVNGFPCPHQFICIPDEHKNESLILGISWMRTYKAVPDWDKNHLELSLKGGQLVIPIAPSKEEWKRALPQRKIRIA